MMEKRTYKFGRLESIEEIGIDEVSFGRK